MFSSRDVKPIPVIIRWPSYFFKFSLSPFYFRAGNICTYVSNQRMTTAIDTIEETAKDNLDDIDTYLELVQKVLISIFWIQFP